MSFNERGLCCNFNRDICQLKRDDRATIVISLSPQGRGWGEGVRKLQNKLHRPNPLILSFSPNSASKTRVNALMGRRDAACTSRLGLTARKPSAGDRHFRPHSPDYASLIRPTRGRLRLGRQRSKADICAVSGYGHCQSLRSHRCAGSGRGRSSSANAANGRFERTCAVRSRSRKRLIWQTIVVSQHVRWAHQASKHPRSDLAACRCPAFMAQATTRKELPLFARRWIGA